MATPMVTGAVAQIYQKWPSLKPEQVKSLLNKNARDMGMESTFEGSGALNMTDAFAEPEKNSIGQNSILSMLFGEGSIFSKFFGKKQVTGDSWNDKSILKSIFNIPFRKKQATDNSESQKTTPKSLLDMLFGKNDVTGGSEKEKSKSNDFNPLSLAMLMLLPMAFI